MEIKDKKNTHTLFHLYTHAHTEIQGQKCKIQGTHAPRETCKNTHTKDKYPQKGTFAVHKQEKCVHAYINVNCVFINKYKKIIIIQTHTDSK